MNRAEKEIRRLELQGQLDSERSALERNIEGQVATPPRLAEQIIEVALSLMGDREVRFLDPGLGSGAFFSALLRKNVGIHSALGIERDPRFVRVARSLWRDQNLEVVHDDFTSLKPSMSSSLIVANPPYVRHHHLESSVKNRLKRRVREELGIEVSGLAGLYIYFLMISHSWMDREGVAAWLIPSEWMSVNYGTALRHYFTDHTTLLRVHVFDAADVQFGDALVSSSVVFFRRNAPSAEHEVHFTSGNLLSPSNTQRMPQHKLRWESKWSTVFLGDHHTSTSTIADYFEIRRGIATGRNKFFIQPLSEFLRIGVPYHFLRPILPSSRNLQGRIIRRRPDGYPNLESPLALLNCVLPEKELREGYPAVWEYLNSEDAEIAKNSYLARHRELWYCQEDREPAPFLMTYMGRGRNGHSPFRVFGNRSDAIATNSYHLMYPREPLKQYIDRNPDLLGAMAETLEGIAADWYQHHGREYGGGLHKLEPKELASLPGDRLSTRFDIQPAQEQYELL